MQDAGTDEERLQPPSGDAANAQLVQADALHCCWCMNPEVQGPVSMDVDVRRLGQGAVFVAHGQALVCLHCSLKWMNHTWPSSGECLAQVYAGMLQCVLVQALVHDKHPAW